jgi:hypothetical protein
MWLSEDLKVAGGAARKRVISRTSKNRWRVGVENRGHVVADRTFDRSRRGSVGSEQRRGLDQGYLIDPRRGDVTLAEMATIWLEYRRQTVARRTWESDASAMSVHVLPAFGRRPVRLITRADVSRFAVALGQHRRPKTVSRIVASLSAFMAHLVEDGRIRKSPVVGQRAPAPDNAVGAAREIRPYAMRELLEVVIEQRALSPTYAEVTLVLGLSGLSSASYGPAGE